MLQNKIKAVVTAIVAAIIAASAASILVSLHYESKLKRANTVVEQQRKIDELETKVRQLDEELTPYQQARSRWAASVFEHEYLGGD